MFNLLKFLVIKNKALDINFTDAENMITLNCYGKLYEELGSINGCGEENEALNAALNRSSKCFGKYILSTCKPI